MSKILIVDDNTEYSETLKTNLELYLEEIKSNMDVFTILPFKDKTDYFNYLQNNDISVLIIDEKLNDKDVNNDGPVDYKGSDLVTFLRRLLNQFPIFCITSFSNVEELKNKASEFEGIFDRKDFLLKTNQYAPKIWRAANNFLNENLKELSEFNTLTTLISNGDNNPENIEKLKALQAKLQIPFNGFDDRNKWLNEYEDQIKKLEDLKNKINAYLDKQ